MSRMHLFPLLAVCGLLIAASADASLGVHTPEAASNSHAARSNAAGLPFPGEGGVKAEEDGKKKEEGFNSQKKDYIIADCQPGDLEPIRQILLRTPEYPVKYSRSTMRSFADFPLFYDLSVVAREVEAADPADAETEAESDWEAGAAGEKERQKKKIGRVVGVVGAGEDRRGTVNVLMVAVDKEFRRRGIARAMLQAVLTKASRLAASSKRGSLLTEAMLHVWVPQLAPVQLYLSLGFTPTRYLRGYYSGQSVSAGYEMHLPLPYEKATERLQFDISLKEARLKELVNMWSNLKAGRGLPKPEEDPVKTTAFVHLSSDAQLPSKLRAFLEEAAPRGSDLAAIFREITDPSLSHFSFLAVQPTGEVTGAIWVRKLVKDGIIDDTAVLTAEDSDGYIFSSLFECLLKKASQQEEHRVVRHTMYCENVQKLHLSWRLGFHPVKFDKVANRKWLGYSTYEYTLEAALPWTPSQEVIAFKKASDLDRGIQYMTDLLTGEPETPFSSSESDLELFDLEARTAGSQSESTSSFSSSPSPSPPPVEAAQAAQEKEDSPSPTAARLEQPLELVSGGKPPAEESQAEEKTSQTGISDGIKGGEFDQSEAKDRVPWYRTVAGVAGMVFTCSILMFFCFRSCAKRRQAVAAADALPPARRVFASEREKEEKEMEAARRPAGRREGYAHVGDQTGEGETDPAAWWDEDEADVYNFS